MDAFWGLFGRRAGASWEQMSAAQGTLGPPREACPRGASWRPPGASWKPLGLPGPRLGRRGG
eukprot:5388869-Pyramimonas_sp.AAC.1